MISINHVQDEVSVNGFAHINLGNYESTLGFASKLGPIILQTEVRIKQRSSTYLTGHENIPPHTDHPDAKFILWYCHDNESSDGDNLLIDGRKIIESMPLIDQSALSQLNLLCPDRLGLEPKKLHPVWIPETRSVFYAPWLRLETPQSSLDAFEHSLLDFERHRFRVALKSGEALLVDNHRMLHYRNKLETNSKRWLTRFWINSS